ncbi:MAG: polysaccharide biosynthesis protein [Thermoanaerobacteraceae bacterium]|nr:polysaccharide biosynthesis protein [Thermoanaerobacteraceae bacterium]
MRRVFKALVIGAIDILIINASFLIAFLLRYDGNVSYIVSSYAKDTWYILIIVTIIKLACFILLKLYTSLWMYAGMYEAMMLGLALITGNAVVVATVSFLPLSAPLSVFITAFFVETLFIGGTRFMYRFMRRIKYKGFDKNSAKRLMIIGGGEAGSVIVRELQQSPYLNSKAVAIIDDNKAKRGMKLHGVPIVGDRHDIVRVAKEKDIDEIIIAMPSAPKKEISAIYNECMKTNCKVRMLPSISHIIDGRVSIKRVRDVELEDLLGREPVKVDLKEIAAYLKGKVILVTGGGGSIGSELCRQIAGFSPERLIILDYYENNAFDIQNELKFNYPGLDLKVVIANIRERPRIDEIFRQYRPEVVFHAAAHKHVPLMEENPQEAIKSNVFGTLNVVESADRYGTSRFILISTDKAVNPTNVMGATKRIAEMIIQATGRHSKTRFAAVRFGNVLGSNGSVVPLFKKQIERGGPVTVTHPEVARYFMTIPEAVQLVIQAGAMAEGGEIFVLDMGQPVKIYDLAKNLIRLSGYKPDEDIKIIFTGLRPGEKLYEELLLKEEGLRTTKHDKIFVAKPIFTDSALLKRELDVLRELLIEDEDGIIDYISVNAGLFLTESPVKN